MYVGRSGVRIFEDLSSHAAAVLPKACTAWMVGTRGGMPMPGEGCTGACRMFPCAAIKAKLPLEAVARAEFDRAQAVVDWRAAVL